MQTRTMWRTTVLMMVFLIALASLAGCSSMAGKMSGAWQIEGTDETITFNSGSSLVSSNGPGTYRSVDNTHVRLALAEAGVGGLVSGEYEISFPDGDTMVLVNTASGNTSRLTRAE
ncbi:MAG: hypothetical protein ACYC5O_24410 [Anaerolineae bacterium]